MVTNVNTFHPPLFDSSTKITNMSFCGDQYYEKIGSIQQSMHEREKMRLELERELFAYSRSDKRFSQIKCAKLHGYLKEIGERETRAKMRNLELLRDVECIEMSMKEHRLDRGPLRQHKAECLNRISRFMAARTKKEEEEELGADKVDVSHRRCQDESFSHLAEGFHQPPAVIFMSRQTSSGSAAEDTTTSVHSHQASHRSPNCSTRSPERLPSGLLKDSKVFGEAAAVRRAHLSDDISGSNVSPDSYNLSDKHERTAAAVPSVRALAAAAGSVPCGGDDEQAPSPPLTFTRSEKNTSSPGCVSPVWARDSPAEYTHSREAVHQRPTKEEAERGRSSSMPQTELEKESQDVLGRSESVSLPSSKLSVSSESDLSISLTDSELEEEPAKGVAHLDSTTTRVAPERSAPPGGSDSHSLHSQESSFHSEESKNRVQVERDSISPEALSERLSHEGLFHLFESIEGRLCGERTNIYRDSSVDRRKRQEIISLCNGRAGLNDEDLEACGAVVLHELPRLSWSTARGCLLPQELVSAHRSSSTRPGEMSSILPPDAARLWDRWFKHALLLKELHVLSTEHLVQLFTPPLLERHATYSHQAKELVRTLLCWPSEECPSAEEESRSSSSCSLPSLLDDSGELRSARPAKDHRMQELQSAEEDSQDESPVESIPIKETKAYQLLKQSATQERLSSSGEEEENGLSGINDDHEVDPGRDKRSSHEDPYPRKEKTNAKPLSAVQSKAFWGESDDSDSEIEAALRPQPFYRNVDSLDDFYD